MIFKKMMVNFVGEMVSLELCGKMCLDFRDVEVVRIFAARALLKIIKRYAGKGGK